MSYFKKIRFFIFFVLLIGFPVHSMEEDSNKFCFLRKIPAKLLIEVASKSKSSIDLFKVIVLLRSLDKKFKKLIDEIFPEFTQFFGKPCKDDEQFELYTEKLFDWLYKVKGSIDTRGKFGRTFLHVAAINNNFPAVKALLALHANSNILDSLGYVAYQHALKEDNQPIINLFEQQLSKEDCRYLKRPDLPFFALRPDAALEVALDSKNYDVVKEKLLQQRPALLDWLIRTVYDRQLFKEIYDEAEIDDRDYDNCTCMNGDYMETCLDYANSDAFCFLLENGNIKNKNDCETKKRWLLKAAFSGMHDIFEYLNYVELKNELNYDSELFLKAFIEGQLSVIHYLNINHYKQGKYPGLRHACCSGRLHIVKYLVEHGADINDAYIDGSTPLVVACAFGFLNIARFLVEKGADTQILDNNGKTARDHAATNKHTKIVEFLEQHELLKKIESLDLEEN